MAAAAVDINEKVISMNLDIMEEQRGHIHNALDHYVDEVFDAGRQWTTSTDRNQTTFLEIYKVMSKTITFLSLKCDEIKREQLSCIKREASHVIRNEEVKHQQENLLLDSGVQNTYDFPAAEPITTHGDGKENDPDDVRNTQMSRKPNLESDQQTRYSDLYSEFKIMLGKKDGTNLGLIRKLDNLRQEVESLKSDVGNVNQYVKSGNTFTEDCSQKVAFLESVVSRLSGKVDDINTDLSAHIVQVRTDLSDKVDQIDTDMSAHIAHIVQVQSDLTDKVDKINIDLSDKVEKINTDLSDKVDKINTNLSVNVDKINTDLSDKVDKINTHLSVNVDKINTDLSDKVDKINTDLSDKVDKINTDLSAHIVQVQKGISDKVDQLDTDLSDKIDKINTDLSAKADQINTDLSAKVDQINTNLSEKVHEIDAELSANVNQVNEALQTLSNCKKEHASEITKIIDLENRCYTMEKDIENNAKQVQRQLVDVGTKYTVIRELLVKRLEPLETLRDILNDRATKQNEYVRKNHLEPHVPPM